MMDGIEDLVNGGRIDEAIEQLESYLSTLPDEDLLLRLGELYYRQARHSDALNKFNAVLRINPENQKARNYVTMINGILDYYCKDLLNP